MKLYELNEIAEENRFKVGAKAYALARLIQSNYKVPNAIVLGSDVYRNFVEETGLSKKIAFILGRKNLDTMRWEEKWDLTIQIKNLFLRTNFPPEMHDSLVKILNPWKNKALAIRSSSTIEDSPKYSFAGLHESYINITEMDSILKHIKLVWASLWSFTALLYQKELNLDTKESVMAVIVQELVFGEKSGIAFSRDPVKQNDTIIIEAVYGLNQALVDGSIEPDRWIINKKTRKIQEYSSAIKEKQLVTTQTGVKFEPLTSEQQMNPVLDEQQINEISEMVLKLEEFFHNPQDSEWTIHNQNLTLLQSRPITTIQKDESAYSKDDRRTWYLSLLRSMEDLEKLRLKIETKYFPEMDEEYRKLQTVDLTNLSDSKLAIEIENRYRSYKKWESVYWDEFIPLAHGIRIFGKIYNEKINPKDPYEYVNLLKGTQLLSVQRNQILEELSEYIRKNQDVLIKIERKQYSDPKIQKIINELEEKMFKHSSLLFSREDSIKMIDLLVELSHFDRFPIPQEEKSHSILENRYFTSFSKEDQEYAQKLLDFGRACYRLRDDDNIYLGKIEKSLSIALYNAQNRLLDREIKYADRMEIANILLSLRDKNFKPPFPEYHISKPKKFDLKVRQIVGQPSSSGTVRGKAQVIRSKEDLFKFKKDSILVVDSVEPNMTFVIPLVKGIVEQRGGYLVHGAIIAREYKIPCVTGVPNAITLIDSGDELVVDGDFGLVIVNKKVI